MIAGKKLTDFTTLFSPYDFDENDKIIESYCKDEWNWLNKIVGSKEI